MTILRSPRGISRRTANSMLGAAGLAAASAPFGYREAWARDNPLVMTWAGWDDPALIESYIARFGSEPNYSFFTDTAEAFQKVRSGFSVDLAEISVTDTRKWKDAGLIQPIDPDRLTTWNEFYEPMKTLETQWLDDQLYYIPTMYGSVSILYRTDIVDVEEESWSMLWDERYAGRIAPIDFPVENVVQVGLGLGMPNPWAMTDEELEVVRETLEKQAERALFYWSDPTTVEQALVNGEVVIASAWSEMAPRVAAQGVPIAYANPVEGRMATQDGLSIASDAEADMDKIYAYIDARTSAETGAFCMTSFGMVNPNKLARDLVPEDVVEAMGANDIGATMASAKAWQVMDPRDEEKYIQLYDEVRAGF